jgi:hypothetical protein
MQSLAQNNPQDKTQDSPQVNAGCMLGRELKDCPIKRAGCNSLYAALMHVMPPYHLRLLVRDQLAHDKAAQDWLRRLDDVLPEQRNTRRRW